MLLSLPPHHKVPTHLGHTSDDGVLLPPFDIKVQHLLHPHPPRSAASINTTGSLTTSALPKEAATSSGTRRAAGHTNGHPEQVPQPGSRTELGHQDAVDGNAEERQEGQAGNLQGPSTR